MFKKLIAASMLTATLLSGAATAQDGDPFIGPYVAGEIGYENGEGGFDQFIFGGAAGYSIPLNEEYFFAGEAEIHWSELDAVDFTWGVTANLGYKLDQDLAVFGRVGYREFNFDGFGSDGDYTLGLGVQYALSETLTFRPILDTVAFDTIGVRAGVAYSF